MVEAIEQLAAAKGATAEVSFSDEDMAAIEARLARIKVTVGGIR